MIDFLASETEKFAAFFSANSPHLKKQGGGVLSYVVELPKGTTSLNIDSLLNRSNISFFYEQPEQHFLIISSDHILEINDNGEGRFAVIDKKLKEFKKSFISNWLSAGLNDLPLFNGGMKFNVEHSDQDWKEFSDSNWFIPESSFVHKNGREFFIFNVLLPASKEHVIKKFKQKLGLFRSQSDDNLNFALRLGQITGNTPKDRKKWKALLGASLEKISHGNLNKVVLSRIVELKLLDELSFNFVLEKFRVKFPNCTLFCYKRGKSLFFGATPEKLAVFRNSRVELDALAGSKQRGSDEEEDIQMEKELTSDPKIKEEHSFVVKHLNGVLNNYLDEIITEDPVVLKLDNIQHLLTRVSGYLKDENCMFNLVKEVFPTPAVCGYPKDKALQTIKKLEEHQRGLYSGIIGWFNYNGNADFVIAIRSALYSNKKLLAYAGSGIVENSNPDDEFNETELKLRSIISLFNENKN